MKGASNSMGTYTMDYLEGESYDMDAGWQEDIAKVFIDNNAAQEVGGGKKKKVVSPVETKTAADK